MKKEYDPIQRAKRSPKSLRAAVDAKCWDCQGRNADPAPRWRIGNCQVGQCSLYPVRPYQSHHLKPIPIVLLRHSSTEAEEYTYGVQD